MQKNRAKEIKEYISSTFVEEDNLFREIKNRSLDEKLPNIAIPQHVGKLLYILTKLQKPKRILEVGTLAGYSTLWLAQAAPEAQITTIEFNEKYATIASHNFNKSPFAHNISLIVGDAHKVLSQFVNDGTEDFDLIFLDADKEGYPHYLPLLYKLSHPGTLLLTDNLIPKHGDVRVAPPHDDIAKSTYQYNDLLANHPHLETILVTTIVGDEGRIDAIGVSLVKE